MDYKNGDYVSVRHEGSILQGTLHTNGLVSLAEDETGNVLGMTGPEDVEIETGEERVRVKGSDILSPLEVLKMQRQQP